MGNQHIIVRNPNKLTEWEHRTSAIYNKLFATGKQKYAFEIVELAKQISESSE